MAIQDVWFSNLTALVEAEGGGRLGVRSVADLSGLSEEYVYQLVKKKPNSKGIPREVGKYAAGKIAKAFAQGRDESWFDQDHSKDVAKPEVTLPARALAVAPEPDPDLAGALRVIAEALMPLDATALRRASGLLADLGNEPEQHASLALLLAQVVASGKRRAA